MATLIMETRDGSGSAVVTRKNHSPAAPQRLSGLSAGTRLLTPSGYRAVETLRRGDQVAVLIGRGPLFVPIMWIGRRRNPAGRAGHPLRGNSVRIRRGAIADRMPQADLCLAAEHAVYLQGSLIPVHLLVNGSTIAFDAGAQKSDTWGVQLERHNLLVAENLTVESLLPRDAAAFSEVTTPHLALVGAAQPADARTGPLNFPARMRMSIRWFRKRIVTRAAMPPAPHRPPSALSLPPPGYLDVETEAHAVVESLVQLVAQRGVRLQLALTPGLWVRMEQGKLRELLGAMLSHAIHSVTGGEVLLGAMHHADQVQIVVVDEDPGGDRIALEAQLREVAAWAALQGGSLEVQARPGEGATLLLQLFGQSATDTE